MTTEEQQKFVAYVKAKVKQLFATYHAPAHGFDHALRVAKWARVIAESEREPVWISEVIALLHDVGRTAEHKHLGKGHHELSYEMCREWFRKDPVMSKLDKRTKLIILYSVRYHYNDVADKYVEAIILRDADKIDALGAIGVKRCVEYCGGDEKKMQLDLRLHYQIAYWIRTNKGKQIFKEKDLLWPVTKASMKLLKKMITEVEL